MLTKICTKCNMSKPTSDFHKAKERKFGVRSRCKSCELESARIRYLKNSEKYKRKAKEYRDKGLPESTLANKIKLDRQAYYKRKKNKDWWEKEKARTSKWKRENREYERARWMAYKSTKLQRTPPWANLEAIKEFYLECPEGYEVDHVIPLQGKDISGLHIRSNLQYLTRSENASKSNRWSIK